jgi:two-component system chemotaxis response regulator CheB
LNTIRILVVDDSVVIRKLLCDTLAQDPDLEIVGSASNGHIALAKILQLKPDLVTLDVEMPVLNGLQTLGELRRLHLHMPVIMFSTLPERGGAATLEALALGAADYATKPSNSGNTNAAMESVRTELIPKIKALCRRRKTFPEALAPRPLVKPRRAEKHRIEIVAIGTSTGGPNALAEVMPKIPQDFPVPIVVVQHMPPVFTRQLAERLTARSVIPVVEGAAGAQLSGGRAWIAPGDFHMTVQRGATRSTIALNQNPPENSCRPAVDVLFRSVAAGYRENVLAVVMTGMGADGALGARSIHDAGGEIIVQDEGTSVVWGMPGLVHSQGLADGVYPLGSLALEITRRVVASRSENAFAAHHGQHSFSEPSA